MRVSTPNGTHTTMRVCAQCLRSGAVTRLIRVSPFRDPAAEKAKTEKTVRFDYQSEGGHIMAVAAAPDGTICGGTAFPFRSFSYDPRRDRWTYRDVYGQWNTVARQNDRFFAGIYGGGGLLEWDPAKPWVDTVPGKKESNPQFLVQSAPTINRPHKLLAHPDGRTLVLAGTPDYGLTGGGLLFWDRQTRRHVVLAHERLIPEHSTESLVALPDGKLLGGTTTSPGTGGQRKAKQAELYLLDLATKQVEWHEAVFPGVQGGPLMHVIAAKAVGFHENAQPGFAAYARQIIRNAQTLAARLTALGYDIVSGGTDNHLMLVNLKDRELTGKDAEAALEHVGITVNKNTVPFETRSPFVTSGVRIGTPALTTRGMKEPEMRAIGRLIGEVLHAPGDGQQAVEVDARLDAHRVEAVDQVLGADIAGRYLGERTPSQASECGFK